MRRQFTTMFSRGPLAAFLLCASACVPASNEDDGGVASDAGDDDDAGVLDDAGVKADAGETGDGGSDAGEDPCLDPDPVLGTLTLADGFAVVDSVPLPFSIGAVTTAAEGEEHRLYALDVGTGTVLNLGHWPFDLASSTTMFETLPPDGTEELYPSWFLAFNGARLAAGYTGAFDVAAGVAPGAIALYDLNAAEGAALSYIDSDNNYAAAFIGDALIVNASSLDTLSSGTAIYGLTEAPTVVATYADPSMTYGGPLVATSGGGLVVAGYFGDPLVQHFFLLPPTDVTAALAGESVSLSDAEEILAAPALSAARFGDTLAYVHGDFFNPLEGLRRVSLADGASRAPVDVLTANDACTNIDLLADIGDDLLVGISDDAGRRLVRVREGG